MAAKGKFFKAIKELAGNNVQVEKSTKHSSNLNESKDNENNQLVSTFSKTVISSGMIVEGEIKSSSDIEVNGTVKGPITTTGNLSVTGRVLGELRGHNVTLNGCAVQGNVFAKENITIDADAVILGDIQAKNIAMNPGAKLNGKVTIL